MIIFPALTVPGLWEEWRVDLIDCLAELPHVTGPKDGPLFGPYRMRDGASRCDAAVIELTHAVLDFDDVPEETFWAAIERAWTHRGYLYSTWSHGTEPKAEKVRARFPAWDGGPCVRARLVLELARPVAAKDWPLAWAKIAALYPEADPQCSDRSRAYYLPTAPAERLALAFASRLGGAEPLDARGLVAPIPTEIGDALPIAEATIKRLVRKWCASADYPKQRLGASLERVRQGLPFAPEGERNATAWALVSGLTLALRRVPPASIAATLRPSLEVMGLGAPSVAEILAMAHRAAGYQPKPDAAGFTLADEVTAKILADIVTDDPLHSLVLQNDGDYWVLTYDEREGCQYLPAKRESLACQAADKLAWSGVPLFAVKGEETRDLLPHEIVARYGAPIESVIRSFTVPHPQVRKVGAARFLVLPAAPPRAIEARYHEPIDTWLRMLGGDRLLDWIALAPDTDQPLAALMLIGAPGTGKSLLAKGLAKVWTEDDPPTLRAAFDSFNTELARCPIVFADEDLPRDQRGKVRTSDFREFIQRNKHVINTKYRNPSILEGYPRVIAAANNTSILDFGSDSLTPADLAAIQARLCVIDVHEGCADYLSSRDVSAWADVEIAEHALWLAQNRGTERAGRFGVAVDSGASYLFAHGIRASVFEWVVKFLLNPRRVNVQADVTGDALVIRVADLDAHWTSYLDSARPNAQRIATALRVFEGWEGRVRIPLDLIFDWIRVHNYCDPADVARSLAAWKVTPLRVA